MKKILEAQKHLAKAGVDGWLLYDFHGMNDLALQFLDISGEQLVTRRFFYWIPRKGEPVKILHAIEPHTLDHFPGKSVSYFSWQSLQKELKKILKGKRNVAMEYSPMNAIPYVSRVDGGTVDLIRSFGVKVVSSGDFLPYFTAKLTPHAIKTHFEAAKVVDTSVKEAFAFIKARLQKGKRVNEYDVQQKILESFSEKGFQSDGAPICGVNAHSADPHYGPTKKNSSFIRKGDFILIDLWCKKKGKKSVFADITRVGVAAKKPSKEQKKVFQIVRAAQKKATDLVLQRFAKGRVVKGFEVDDASRGVIRKAGFEKYFLHRTGHSIEYELHGSGAHMDNIEMHDERPILKGTCFSVEPGIYLPGKFGVRLEYDLLIDLEGKVYLTGGSQDEITCLF